MNRTVVVLADDLFWKTKIDQAAKSAQAPIVFLSDPGELAKAVDPSRASIVLIDLSLRKEPFAAIAALKKSARAKSVPIIGYHEHVRKDLQEKAAQAGCDQVLSRSTFSQNLSDLIMKYTLPGATRTEEEEKELPEE
jgi:PleD family two-component response regulator